ncbi:MAG: hypothetical protein HOV81_18585 [Kofleriaceae bacterium]|nr:hypothetical protein [Kofleriaceae bacterium]
MRRPLEVIAIGCLIGIAPAHADNIDFHATANGSVATTDNANGTPTGQAGRDADVFSDVRPGFIVTYNAPRMIHELLSEVDFLYHLASAKPSVTFRGSWKAYFVPSPRTEQTFDLEGSIGQLNNLDASASPADDPTLVRPLGRTDTKNAAASEAGTWVASEFSRLSQRGVVRYTTTDDNMFSVHTESFEVGGGISFDRQFRYNTLLLELGASFLRLERLDPMMVQMGDRLDRQLNPRAVVVWQHDYNQKWSSNFDGGVVYVNPLWTDPYNPTDDRKGAFFPVFGGLVAYTDVWGRATATARRQVTPNLFIAQNTVSDSLNITAAMPLTLFDKDARRRDPKVVGIGTVGVDRTQLIDPSTGGLEGRFFVARVDVGVGWSPRPGQTFGLRYEFQYQVGDQVAEMIVPSFFRNTFYFTFALRYPEEVQVRVPRRGNSVRSDRKDLSPIGAEPVIVDPTEFLNGGGGDR